MILSAALVRPAMAMETTCDGGDVAGRRPCRRPLTAAAAITTATITRPRVSKPDIPRTVPHPRAFPRPGVEVTVTRENV